MCSPKIARPDLFGGGSCSASEHGAVEGGGCTAGDIYEQPVVWGGLAKGKFGRSEVTSNSHPGGEYAMVGRMERCDTRLSNEQGPGRVQQWYVLYRCRQHLSCRPIRNLWVHDWSQLLLAAFYVSRFFIRGSRKFYSNTAITPWPYFFMSGYLALPRSFLLSGFILAYTYKGQILNGTVTLLALLGSSICADLACVCGFSAAVFGAQFHRSVPRCGAGDSLHGASLEPFDLGMSGAWNMVCWTLSVVFLLFVLSIVLYHLD